MAIKGIMDFTVQSPAQNLYFPFDKRTSQLKGIAIEIYLKAVIWEGFYFLLSGSFWYQMWSTCYGIAGEFFTELNMLTPTPVLTDTGMHTNTAWSITMTDAITHFSSFSSW